MALTPDELLNKEFPETKFRPGYDKDEVDDFLDEVVVEWRRLVQENEDLKAQVSTLEEQLEENPADLEPDDLEDAGLSGYAGTDAEVTGTFDSVATEDPADDGAVPSGSGVTAYPEYEPGHRPAQTRREAAAQPAEGSPSGPGAASSDDAAAGEVASTAAGVLAMAQKLHDQYVSEGEETRAQYIAEGEKTRAEHIAEGEKTRDEYVSEGEKTRAEHIAEGERKRTEIVTEAETRAENMIEEAEMTSSRTLSALERKKTDLETKVSELTSFERDYRTRIKNYIEGQLEQLTSRGSIEKEAGAAEI
ncbi:DivIVA domain-containing protein [Nesterenkonia halophila]|uniref:DivIVA domain-containing protein n=1 Tax=Nesterenkonia halophila TaxID=302044 RepID=UPI001291D047|nr:DivIVA domain-containing protein [Nesterenkonia halophila]